MLPWWLIFPALLLIWSQKTRTAALWMLVAGYAVAFVTGQLTWPALVVIAVLGGSAAAITPERPLWARIAGHLAFVLVAVLLRLHVLPGFQNPMILSERVSAAAPDYRMYFNFDKTLILVWVIWAWRNANLTAPWRTALAKGTTWGVVTAAACIGLGLLGGLVAWNPKWPDSVYLWALNNLLLVCLTEEAMFRGYVQEALAGTWRRRAYGAAAAVAAGAVLFGLAHFASGPQMMAIATIAGVGYGLAYRAGGLLAATVAHAVLNLIHFSFFTYPMLAQ